MAPMATELATLRALTFRISSTPTSQLPQHVPAIASSLPNCKTILSSAQASTSKTASEASVAVHKYRTLLSALLQDRTFQGRWAAIVLIKSTIEIGGWETLQKSLPWVRGLLGILNKPDPFSAKQLCIITLTRIFLLTRDYPTLVREITTPSLSPFIQSSLQVAASRTSPALLETVLDSFNQLLPRHPTTFRSHLKHIHQLLGQTIAPTPSSKISSEQAPGARSDVTLAVAEAARRLYTQLPCSAPKGATADEWQSSLKKTIMNTHRVGDKVFRAVLEDWKPTIRDAANTNGRTLDDTVQDVDADPMSLPPWSGIFAGAERLLGLLCLVKSHILCPTTGPVNLTIGALVDLLARLFSLTVPSTKGQGLQNALKLNNQVSKEERENLWLILPSIHVAAIDILLALLHRSDASTTAIDTALLDQICWLFTSEKDSPAVRTACYLAITELLLRSGVALPKSSVDQFGDIIRRCCDDILPLETNGPHSKPSLVQSKSNGAPQATTNADAFLKVPSANNPSRNFTGLQAAAHALLPVLFTHLRPQHLSDSLRSRMDRTAVLVRDKDAMLASVLNPPPSKRFGKPAASILPFLARSQSREKEVEALIRPRMPVVRTGTTESEIVDGDDEEDELEELQEDIQGDDEFVGNELDTLLGTTSAADVTENEAMVTEANAIAAPESHERAIVASKRPQEDNLSLSAPKRVKVNEEQQQPHVALAAVPTTVVAPEVKAPTVIPEQPALSHTPTLPVPVAPVVPSLADKQGEVDSEEDDEDNDKISLVLGQDTDSESE